MFPGVRKFRFAPEGDDDTLVVSKRKFGELEKEVDRLREEVRRKEEEVRKRDERIAEQKRKLKDLERQLAVHLNPNVPPSVRHHAPGYARVRPRVPPEERGKPGARPGHEGRTREPLPADEQVDLTAKACGHCRGHRLKLRGTETEQQVEVEHRRKVTDYKVHIYECEDCGETVRSRLPSGREPSGYGPQLQTDIVMDKVEGRLPYRKVEERLERQGIPSCPATLQGVVWGASERLEGTWREILERVRQAPVVYADETSYCVGGEKWWCWTFTTMEDVLFVLRHSRGEDVVREVLGVGFPGKVVVCDGWKAYPHPTWVLQRCWAHLLRVAKVGAEESPKGKDLYAALTTLYGTLTENLENADEGERARRARRGEHALDRLVARFGRSWAGGVRKVMTYLQNGRDWWLTFLRRPGVEPTNNRAERALREGVVIRKIVGTLRNYEGATALTRLLSVIGTWKLRGEDPAKNLYVALN